MSIRPSVVGAGSFEQWETIRANDGLPSDKVFCVLADGSRVWVGTDQGLAYFIEEGAGERDIRLLNEEGGLPHRVINALALSERTGDLWIATMGGLARLSAGRVDRFDQRNSGLINDVVYSVAVHGDEVWAATAAGVSVYHVTERRWELFDQKNTLMHEPWCYSLSLTPTNVYVGVWGGGVVERDVESAVWKEYRDPDGEMEIDLLRDDGLIHDVTTSVSAGDGALWVGTYFGLSRYDGRRWRSWLEHDSGLPSNFINYVWADGPGVWICTDSGLAYYDESAWTVYTSGKLEGSFSEGSTENVRCVSGTIAHDFVSGVHPQGDVLWVATANGLSRGRRVPRVGGS